MARNSLKDEDNEKNEKVFATRELETEEMTSLYETEQEAMKNYDSYKVDSAKVSDTAFKIYLTNCNGIAHNVKYYNTFNLTNYDATDNLKVHLFKENGDEIIVELTKER